MAAAPAPSSRPGAPAQSLARTERLRRRQDFVAVLQDGRRVRHRLLSLGVRPNGLAHNRVGYAVGKRVGNAVTRNRVRRRLRAILAALPLAPGHDLVVTAGDQSAAATFDQLRDAVRATAARAGLVSVHPEPVEGRGRATRKPHTGRQSNITT